MTGHPKTVDRVRSSLAKWPLGCLILFYPLLLAMLALLAAVGLRLFQAGDVVQSFITWWWYSFLRLCATNLPGVESQDNLGHHVLSVSLSLGSVILPALFFGAVVFKLLISPDVFTYRKTLSLCRLDPVGVPGDVGRWHLVIRFYSSTKLMLADLSFRVIARIQYYDAGIGRSWRNKTLRINKPEWSLATTHMPFALGVELDDGDLTVDEQNQKFELNGIQGNSLEEGCRLLLVMKGVCPELGNEFVETHWYAIPQQVVLGKFRGVNVDIDRPSWTWNWPDFEENQPH